jgi:hypothetical protein
MAMKRRLKVWGAVLAAAVLVVTVGCESGSHGGSASYGSAGYYNYYYGGYYPGYPGYWYDGDTIVVRPPGDRPGGDGGHVSTLPADVPGNLPSEPSARPSTSPRPSTSSRAATSASRPATRSMPAARPMGGGRRR